MDDDDTKTIVEYGGTHEDSKPIDIEMTRLLEGLLDELVMKNDFSDFWDILQFILKYKSVIIKIIAMYNTEEEHDEDYVDFARMLTTIFN